MDVLCARLGGILCRLVLFEAIRCQLSSVSFFIYFSEMPKTELEPRYTFSVVGVTMTDAKYLPEAVLDVRRSQIGLGPWCYL